MNRTMARMVIPVALACALAVPALGEQSAESTSVQQNGAQQSASPHGPALYKHGHRWRYGSASMGGCDHGYGMGRGMMHGYGLGPGMMHGYGMRPGMMWGSGMGFYTGHALGLSEHQREEIEKIWRETADKNWQVLGKLRDARENLYDLYGSAELDAAAVTRAYKHVSELRQEMFENRLNAQERITKVLTAGQRKTWRSMHRGMGFGMMEGYEP